MAARTPTPNQTIIENLQNETDILQTSLSEKERLSGFVSIVHEDILVVA
jgi:hypothetical protein